MARPRPQKATDRRAAPPQARERILRAAAGHFARRGFGGASIRDIAKTSGVGLSTVLYHFRSKQNLFQETIRHFTLDLGHLNHHFTPVLSVDVSDEQALADALHVAIASFLAACHGPDSVPGLLDLYLRVLLEGNHTSLQMLLDCFAPLQANLVQWVQRLRPTWEPIAIAFWQQLLWSLLQYTVVSKRLVLYDMKLADDYTADYLAAASWHFACYCCRALQLPLPSAEPPYPPGPDA